MEPRYQADMVRLEIGLVGDRVVQSLGGAGVVEQEGLNVVELVG